MHGYYPFPSAPPYIVLPLIGVVEYVTVKGGMWKFGGVGRVVKQSYILIMIVVV